MRPRVTALTVDPDHHQPAASCAEEPNDVSLGAPARVYRARADGSARRLLLAGLATLLLAGCGASHAPSTRKPAATAAPGASLSLPDRLLFASRLPAFHAIAPPTVSRSASAWDAVSPLPGSLSANEAAWLQQHGFLAGVRERLAGTFASTAEIYAAVEQFHSPAGARAELAHRYAQARQHWTIPGARFSPFAVPGVPASAGYSWGAGGHAVLFTSGPFLYTISTIAPPGSMHAPSRAQVIAAAKAWSRRMAAGSPV
jgi:hypothetical protein